MIPLQKMLRSWPVFGPLRALRRNWRQSRTLAARCHLLVPLVERNSLCFDIGAYQGWYTEAFLRLGGRVVAVEPQPALAAALQQRFFSTRGVTVIPKAMGANEGSARLFISNTAYHSSLRQDWLDYIRPNEPDALQGVVEVEVTTLDRLIAEFGCPDFIKIDVEGAELNVLHGLHQPVPALSLEYHMGRLEDAAACLGYLGGLARYAAANFTVGHTGAFCLTDWMHPADVLAILQERRSRNASEWGDLYLRHMER